jgi:hypothetical protein
MSKIYMGKGKGGFLVLRMKNECNKRIVPLEIVILGCRLQKPGVGNEELLLSDWTC